MFGRLDASCIYPNGAIYYNKLAPLNRIGYRDEPYSCVNYEYINDKILIFVYVGSSKLMSDEEEELRKYKKTDPEYFNGVKIGWSILFLGDITPVVKEGPCKKIGLLKRIPDIFWINENKCYLTDGSEVTKEYVEHLND